MADGQLSPGEVDDERFHTGRADVDADQAALTHRERHLTQRREVAPKAARDPGRSTLCR